MKAIVIGGSGALGRALVKELRSRESISAVVNIGQHAVEEATHNALFPTEGKISINYDSLLEELKSIGSFDAIYCVAGGWCGGSLKSKTLLSDFDKMMEASLTTSVIGAKLGSVLFTGATSPLLVFTGSEAAFQPQPKMIAYGTAKAATHYFTTSLASNPEGAGLPAATRVRCITPNTLDTPANRAAMPSADYSTWTSLSTLSDRMVSWMTSPVSSDPADSEPFIHV